ncbi:hypothetical protein AVEN_129266-1 [Araneus ventricosus]|uniref:Uncharacterized protein n=1 Tax=Araneus ventricosus TaxID=182803 RepID=A0A4Y2HML5_ARAVE|nr:hypothetical protein AVEN_129266-1 [Araneus ventricosus]
MASRKVSFLEQSTRECSKESALSAGSTASDRANIGPSAVHLDPPTGESPTENNGPSTTLLSCSHPQYSAIGVPVPANGRTIGPEVEEQVANEGYINACSTFWDWYKNTVIDFRNSCFIHIIHLLFSYIPISAIILGSLFTHKCPQTSFLPIFVTVVGVVGVVFMGFWIVVCCCEHNETPCSNLQKFAFRMLSILLLAIVVIEMYLVGQLAPNFDPSAEDYCSKTFYYFVIGKEIVSGAAIIITVLLYFPGSSLHTCCQNCSVPSPASAFFSRL